MRFTLRSDLQTAQKQKQHLHYLLAEADITISEQDTKLQQLSSSDNAIMYDECQAAFAQRNEMRTKYLDSISKISLLQKLSSTASTTSARLRKEKNVAEEKLEVTSAQRDNLQHKLRTAVDKIKGTSKQLADLRLQHPINVIEVSVAQCNIDVMILWFAALQQHHKCAT